MNLHSFKYYLRYFIYMRTGSYGGMQSMRFRHENRKEGLRQLSNPHIRDENMEYCVCFCGEKFEATTGICPYCRSIVNFKVVALKA